MSPRLRGYRERYEDDLRFNFHVPAGDSWIAVEGPQHDDLTRIIIDAIVSTTEVSVELSRPSPDRWIGQKIQGPWCTIEGRQTEALEGGYRAIYQAGVDASGVEGRSAEAIANWVRTLGTRGQLGWTEKDEAQLLALADGIHAGRYNEKRDEILRKVIVNAMPVAMLRPFIVPVRQSFQIVVRDERAQRDDLEPVVGTLFLRTLCSRDVA